MFIFLFIITILVYVLLLLVAGAKPSRSTMSLFELQRRADDEDQTAAELLRREKLLDDIYSLKRIITVILLVLAVLLSVVTFGWLWGAIIAFLMALSYVILSEQLLVKKSSQRLYDKIEPSLLNLAERFPKVVGLIRNTPLAASEDRQLGSREELQHLVMQSGSILSGDEKRLIEHSLRFERLPVSQVMTPRSMIDSVAKNELLGPLVLDKLHKTGHSRFPVFDGDIDHVVGVLYIQNLLTLNAKKSISAEKAMEPRVFYIREDQTLQHALNAFIKTRHHMFLVVNEFRETVGLVTLEDVMEELLGREIVDEFETHDDLRVVATRNPRRNNRSTGSRDV